VIYTVLKIKKNECENYTNKKVVWYLKTEDSGQKIWKAEEKNFNQTTGSKFTILLFHCVIFWF